MFTRIAATAGMVLALSQAVMAATPSPTPSGMMKHTMKSGSMKSSSMKGSSMKGSSMKDNSMKSGSMKSGSMKPEPKSSGASTTGTTTNPQAGAVGQPAAPPSHSP